MLAVGQLSRKRLGEALQPLKKGSEANKTRRRLVEPLR